MTIKSLPLLSPNGVLCFLGVYRRKEACEDFGKVLTEMVLRNRLVFGSVNADKPHFEMSTKDLKAIQSKYGDVLNRMITTRLSINNFKKALSPEKNEIKPIIYFK